MKKVLIVINNFRHGGTNKALLNMLCLIHNKQYKIDLFVFDPIGPYEKLLQKYCRPIYNDWTKLIFSQVSDVKGIFRVKSIVIKLILRISRYAKINLINIILKIIAKNISSYKYDITVAFSEGLPTRLVSYIDCPRKISWIHCDYQNYLKMNGYPDERKIYDKYKYIILCSEYSRNNFIKIFPEKRDAVHVIHNVINIEEVKKLSLVHVLDPKFKTEKFTILSLGRIDSVKRFSEIPSIIRELINRGCVFKWYLIGPNEDKREYKKLINNIEKYAVNDYFFWLGPKDNPYPYLAKSNLLVITSLSESWPFIIEEAKILGIPILSTEFPSIYEIIDNENEVIITDIQKIADNIELIIRGDKEFQIYKDKIPNLYYKRKNDLEMILHLLFNNKYE